MKNGFKALRHVGGGVQRLMERDIADAYAANLFNGDLVTLNAGSVELGAVGDADLVGTFLGCMFVAADGSQKFSPNWVSGTTGATERKALISEDKNVTYKVAALSSANLDAAGTACALATANAGVAKTGQSGMTVIAKGGNSNLISVVKVLEQNVDINGTDYDILEVQLG